MFGIFIPCIIDKRRLLRIVEWFVRFPLAVVSCEFWEFFRVSLIVRTRMGLSIFRLSQGCCYIFCRKITLAKSSSAKGGEKEVTQSYGRSILSIDDDPCSWRAGKSAPGNQRVYGPENDRSRELKRKHSSFIWTVVDAPGRETTCECLVTYERNAECHFRSVFIGTLARSFLRLLEHKSCFVPRNSLIRKKLS